MTKTYPLACVLSSAVLFPVAARADLVTVLPTPASCGPITHDLSGAMSPAQVDPVQNLNLRLSAENPSDPDHLNAKATYILTDSSFFASNIVLNRTSDTSAMINGYVLFRPNQQVYYSLAGNLDVTDLSPLHNATAGLAKIHSELYAYNGMTPLFVFDNADATHATASLDLLSSIPNHSSDANGILEANTDYLWTFQLNLSGNGTATDSASAAGDLALVFSWTGVGPIPEPGTIGLLGAAATALMPRRKK
jgi:hypothetical protein